MWHGWRHVMVPLLTLVWAQVLWAQPPEPPSPEEGDCVWHQAPTSLQVDAGPRQDHPHSGFARLWDGFPGLVQSCRLAQALGNAFNASRLGNNRETLAYAREAVRVCESKSRFSDWHGSDLLKSRCLQALTLSGMYAMLFGEYAEAFAYAIYRSHILHSVGVDVSSRRNALFNLATLFFLAGEDALAARLYGLTQEEILPDCTLRDLDQESLTVCRTRFREGIAFARSGQREPAQQLCPSNLAVADERLKPDYYHCTALAAASPSDASGAFSRLLFSLEEVERNQQGVNLSQLDSLLLFYLSAYQDLFEFVIHQTEESSTGNPAAEESGRRERGHLAKLMLWAHTALQGRAYRALMAAREWDGRPSLVAELRDADLGLEQKAKELCDALPVQGLYLQYANIEPGWQPLPQGLMPLAHAGQVLLNTVLGVAGLVDAESDSAALPAATRGLSLEAALALGEAWLAFRTPQQRRYVRIAVFKPESQPGSLASPSLLAPLHPEGVGSSKTQEVAGPSECLWDVRLLGEEAEVEALLAGTPPYFKIRQESDASRPQGAIALYLKPQALRERESALYSMLFGGMEEWVNQSRRVVFVGNGLFAEVNPAAFRTGLRPGMPPQGEHWYQAKTVVSVVSPHDYLLLCQGTDCSEELPSSARHCSLPDMSVYLGMDYDGTPCSDYVHAARALGTEERAPGTEERPESQPLAGAGQASGSWRQTCSSNEQLEAFACSGGLWGRSLVEVEPSTPSTQPEGSAVAQFPAMPSAYFAGKQLLAAVLSALPSHRSANRQQLQHLLRFHSAHRASEPLFLCEVAGSHRPGIVHVWSHGAILQEPGQSSERVPDAPITVGGHQIFRRTPRLEEDPDTFLRRQVVGFSYANTPRSKRLELYGSPSLPDSRFDGRLTAEELLHASAEGQQEYSELLSLGTCDSGKTGPWSWLGVSGFRRAAMLAGFRSLLLSLRPVIVDHNETFFVTFYRNLYRHLDLLPLSPWPSLPGEAVGGNQTGPASACVGSLGRWEAMQETMRSLRSLSPAEDTTPEQAQENQLRCFAWLKEALGVVCPHPASAKGGDGASGTEIQNCLKFCDDYFGFDYVLIGEWR